MNYSANLIHQADEGLWHASVSVCRSSLVHTQTVSGERLIASVWASHLWCCTFVFASRLRILRRRGKKMKEESAKALFIYLFYICFLQQMNLWIKLILRDSITLSAVVKTLSFFLGKPTTFFMSYSTICWQRTLTLHIWTVSVCVCVFPSFRGERGNLEYKRTVFMCVTGCCRLEQAWIQLSLELELPRRRSLSTNNSTTCLTSAIPHTQAEALVLSLDSAATFFFFFCLDISWAWNLLCGLSVLRIWH